MLWGRKVLNILNGILICYNLVQFSIYFSYSDDSRGLSIASPVMLFHWYYPKCKKAKALLPVSTHKATNSQKQNKSE